MHNYKKNYQNIINFSIVKVNLKWWKLILLGIVGSIYIGMGYIGFIMIIAGMQKPEIFSNDWQEQLVNGIGPNINISGPPLIIAAAIFPIGFLLLVFLGGSLLTSDFEVFTIAVITKKIKMFPAVLKLILTLLGNIIGAFIIAALVRGGHIFNDKHLYVLQQIIAEKVHWEWWQTFFSGILCSILVSWSVWVTMSRHKNAKTFLIYFPILLFALVGFQHVIANFILFAFGWVHADNIVMKNIGQGIFASSLTLGDWSFKAMFINLIPALVGNWLSGAILIPFVSFWLINCYKENKNTIEEDDISNNNENLLKNEEPDFYEFYDSLDEDIYPADELIKNQFDVEES